MIQAGIPRRAMETRSLYQPAESPMLRKMEEELIVLLLLLDSSDSTASEVDAGLPKSSIFSQTCEELLPNRNNSTSPSQNLL